MSSDARVELFEIVGQAEKHPAGKLLADRADGEAGLGRDRPVLLGIGISPAVAQHDHALFHDPDHPAQPMRFLAQLGRARSRP